MDTRVVNTNTASYEKKSLEKILAVVEEEKINKYLEYCLQQRRQFYSFVISVDGPLVAKADATLKLLASRLTTKRWQPYFCTFGYVRSRFYSTMVRATHRCIWRSHVLAILISFQQPQWEDGAGLHIYRYIGNGKI